jgi:GAF domain-containing protein
MSERKISIIEEIQKLPVSNTDEFLKKVVDKLRDFRKHYSWVGIYMVENGFLVLRVFSGEQETSHTRIRIGEGVCGLAAQTGETIIVPDVSKEPRYIECFPSTRSEIVAPIVLGEEVIGEIDVDSDLLDAFSCEDRLLLEETAKIIADKLTAESL